MTVEFNDVYCDMDGVVADFITPACDFFGLKLPKSGADAQAAFDALWPSSQGWPRLKREWPTFWQDLKKAPHAMELWAMIHPYNPSLLSAIPNGWPEATIGKEVWAKKHLPKFGYHPDQRVHGVSRSEKKHFAKQPDGTPNILIDDFDKNTSEWEAAGGIAILYTPGSAGLSAVRNVLNK